MGKLTSTIREVETHLVEIPFLRPFVVWRGEIPSKQHVLVKITTSDGAIGWGEAAPFLFYAPETAADVLSMIRSTMVDELVGRDSRDVRAIMADFEMIDGHEFAKAAIETALWDLLGQRAGLPLYRLLGGALATAVPVLSVLHAAEPEEMASEARKLTAQGFGRLKLKIGFGLERDVAMVAAVREAVGDRPLLRADAEENYDRKEALRIGQKLQPLNLELISQPVTRTDWESMAYLRSQLATPLLADEGIHNARGVLTCVQASAADMVNIKVLKCGGVLESLEMAAICRAAHLPVVVGSMIESGIGTLVAAHLALVLPGLHSTELCGPLLMESTLLDDDLIVRDGAIHLPDRPGLGASVSTELLDRYRVA